MLVAVLGLGSAFVSGCPDVESGRSASEQWITARPCAQAHPPVLESCVAAKGSGYGVDVIEKQRALIREANECVVRPSSFHTISLSLAFSSA